MESIELSKQLLAKYRISTDKLVAAYQEPQRVYHGLDHIEHMLSAIEEMVELYSLPAATRTSLHLATWYHDVVYEIGSPNNEYDSAQMAIKDLDLSYASEIPFAIRKTQDHLAPNSMFEACIIDADLHGLGTEAYWKNRDKVRAEYGPITDEQWKTGRTAFLAAYLNRKTLFFTSWGAQFEGKARGYMFEELCLLQAS